MPNAVILRPSIVFGAEDQFFNRFALCLGLDQFCQIVGAETLFQPVFVDDLAQVAFLGLKAAAAAGFMS